MVVLITLRLYLIKLCVHRLHGGIDYIMVVDNDPAPPSKPRGGGRPRMSRGMPRPFGMRGNRGPPPRFMGPGPHRPPFMQMRSPVRGPMRPFSPRTMPPMERGRPPFRNRPRKPAIEKSKKEPEVQEEVPKIKYVFTPRN